MRVWFAYRWPVAATVLLLICASQAEAQWHKEHAMNRECREQGESLPGGGVILGKYYAGGLNAYKGESADEIIVQAEIHSAVGTYTESATQKRPEQGYLFCMFFRDDPSSANLDDDTRLRMLIPDAKQACQEIRGSGSATIRVPGEAAFIILTLSQNRTTSARTLEGDFNSYWSDRLLLQECGVAPLYGKVCELWLFDPGRKSALPAKESAKSAAESGLMVRIDCPNCQGTGSSTVPESKETCPDCGGTGKRRVPGGKLLIKCEHPLGRCNGTGKITIPAHKEPCAQCAGSGKVAVPRSEARKLAPAEPIAKCSVSMRPQPGTGRVDFKADGRALSLSVTGLTAVTTGRFRSLPSDMPVIRVEILEGTQRVLTHNLAAGALMPRSGGAPVAGEVPTEKVSKSMRITFKTTWTGGSDPELDSVEFAISPKE